MSQIKVKDLPEKIDEPKDDDILIIEDSEDTKKIPLIKLKASFSMDGILTSIKEMLLEKVNSFMEAHNKRYKELEERNKLLEVTCNNLSNDLLHDSTRIADLQNKLLIQSNLVKILQSDNTKLNNDLITLQNLNNNLFTDVVELEYQLSISESNISDLVTEYNNLYSKYEILQEKNNTLKKSVEELETKYNTAIDKFVEDSNNELQTKINELMTYIRFYHPNVDTEV